MINAGDALEFLSGGIYRATIHRSIRFPHTIPNFLSQVLFRVVQPPPDQREHTRLGVFYFCLADDDTQLAPLTDSPVLKRVGISKQFDDAPTMAAWRKSRTSAYGHSKLKPALENGIEEEVIEGIVVKHYN